MNADELIRRLRDVAGAEYGVVRVSTDLLDEAADMIEQMAQRIEADDRDYKELEKRHAD